MMLPAGAPAPDFELPTQHGTTVRLSNLRGRRVVLAFHPLAFTPVCAVQMQNYEKAHQALQAHDAVVLGLSVDAAPSKKVWGDLLGVTFDLLADFHPKGKVAEAYGVMRADGISERAIFVVDRSGRIAWAKQYAIPEQPAIEDVLTALESLRDH